jgi:coatomer protein complex subunit gamma
VKEVDPSSGEVEEEGYDDEYTLEELEVTAADYVKPRLVPNFRKAWCVPVCVRVQRMY